MFATAIAAEAQQAAKLPRVGFIAAGQASDSSAAQAFRQGLRDLGYVEGKNVVLEARFAAGQLDKLPDLVAELIRLKVDVLVAGSPASAAAAKKGSTTVPIVFAGVGDPVASGIVTSLARPGGNVTGSAVGVNDPSFGGKWLELLKEAVPGVAHVAVLANRSNRSNSPYFKGVEAAAPRMNVRIDIFDAGNPAELERALAAIAASGAQAIIVSTDPFLFVSRSKLVSFAASKRLPAIYFFKSFADEGGLMSYGANLEESYRKAATYVDKILKGAKPADLPVEQPTRFEFVINMKTARALGLRVPQSLLLRADHVID
jgi:putative ABC transport system substrate-binding protein